MKRVLVSFIDFVYRNRVKVARRVLAWVCVFLLLLVATYFIAAFLLAYIPEDAKHISRRMPIVQAYLRSNGRHTELMVPVKAGAVDWCRRMGVPEFHCGEKAYKYVSFGWGDRDFFLNTPSWEEMDWKLAMRAILGLGEPTLRVTFLEYVPSQAIPLHIGEDRYEMLSSFIGQSFKKDKTGKYLLERKKDGLRPEYYYASTGKYSLLRTCNTWTNEALKAGGQRACLWTPFEYGILWQYSNEK